VEIPLGEDREEHNTDRGEERMLGGSERRWSDMQRDAGTDHMNVNFEKA
jgi:hypothetical protein